MKPLGELSSRDGFWHEGKQYRVYLNVREEFKPGKPYQLYCIDFPGFETIVKFWSDIEVSPTIKRDKTWKQ